MIIVTGCDNTGKSSLVKVLSKELDMPVADKFICSPPQTPGQWMGWAKWCERCINDPEDKIYDRLFIDEFVYGPVVRGKLDIPLYMMADLSNQLLIRQPLYIYTTAPSEVIKRTFHDREQYPKEEMVDKLLNKFWDVNHSWPINQLVHQYTFDFTKDPDYGGILAYLRSFPEIYKGGNVYGKRS